MLPTQYGKKSTVHGAFMRWAKAGVFDDIHDLFVQCYIAQKKPTYLALDAALNRARYGGTGIGKNPCDRGKNGIKKTLAVDDNGTPLVCLVTPANQHDIIPARALLEKIKNIYPVGETSILAADSAYDAEDFKKALANSNIAPFITQNNRRLKNADPEAKKLRSAHRWIVESTHSWINNFRSLLTRFAKHDFAFSAFYSFACAVIVFRKLHA